MTIHILHNKQQVLVVDVQDATGASVEVVRQGARETVTFQFVKRPQYVRPGMKAILRDGRVRCYGVVTEPSG